MLSEKIRKVVLALILVQFLVIGFLSLQNEMYGWDEASYVINAYEIAGQPLDGVSAQYAAHERHPLLTWTIAGIIWLGMPFIIVKLFSMMLLLAFTWFVYYLAKRYHSRDVGLIAILGMITIPTVMVASSKIMTDIGGGLLFSVSLYFYYVGVKKPKYFLLGGFIGGISIIMRDMNILIAPVVLVMWYVFRKDVNWRYILGSVPIALVSLTPYFWDNYVRWGNPLFRILEHIEMVNNNVGYQSFSLQSWPISWLIFLPIFLGVPMFYLAVQRLRKCEWNNWVKFLVIWFMVPAVIFLLKQKISPRLVVIFLVPVMLLGAEELVRKNWKKQVGWIVIILIVNMFLVSAYFVNDIISVTEIDAELFDFVKTLPNGVKLYSDHSPPSVIALQTGKTTIYSVESKGEYYLHTETFKETFNKFEDPENYEIVFENNNYKVYHARND